MDLMEFSNRIVVSIGIVDIKSVGFDNSNNNIYNYKPEIKENWQIDTEFLKKTSDDYNKTPKSKPIPIPKPK